MGASISTADHRSPCSMISAASAPAAPATMKLGPLQRKFSRQTFHSERREDDAIAPATNAVLTTKYVMIVPAMAFGSAAEYISAVAPPSHAYACPVARIVIASAARLKIVRYGGYGCLTVTGHCVNAPGSATI